MAATPTGWITFRLTATSPSYTGATGADSSQCGGGRCDGGRGHATRSDLNAIGAALAAYTQKTAKLMAKFDVEHSDKGLIDDDTSKNYADHRRQLRQVDGIERGGNRVRAITPGTTYALADRVIVPATHDVGIAGGQQCRPHARDQSDMVGAGWAD